MAAELSQFLSIAHIGTSARIAAYRGMRAAAEELGLEELTTQLDTARDHDAHTLELEKRWAASPGCRGESPLADEFSRTVDPLLSSIRDVALAQAKGMPLEDPLPQRIVSMLRDIFPVGVGVMIQLPLPERLTAIEVLLQKLRAHYAELVVELGLTRKAGFLAARVQECRDALAAAGGRVDYPRLCAAQARGHRLLLQVVARVLGMYYDSENPNHVASRTRFLTPLTELVERIKAHDRAAREARLLFTPVPLDELSDEGSAPHEWAVSGQEKTREMLAPSRRSQRHDAA